MTIAATDTIETTATVAVLSTKEQEELIRAHVPLVGHVVRDMLSRVPNHVHRDDLTSAGLAALVTAARSFDPSRGIPFHRFAATRIRGALLDELRSLDWASRSVRSRARQADTAREQLTAALGRTPTPTELATAMGTSTSELKDTDNDVQRAVVLSLQGFTAGSAEDMVTERTPGPEETLIHREQIGYLHDAIEALPDRLRKVITEYYLDERPMADIAAELGVTDSRISQLRAEALVLLKDGMNQQTDPELVATPERPDGCVAKRRASYYATIAERSTMSTRLQHTTATGMPVRSLGAA
jgi:RNA polymerase sigma factor for flagellar operon FliA